MALLYAVVDRDSRVLLARSSEAAASRPAEDVALLGMFLAYSDSVGCSLDGFSTSDCQIRFSRHAAENSSCLQNLGLCEYGLQCQCGADCRLVCVDFWSVTTRVAACRPWTDFCRQAERILCSCRLPGYQHQGQLLTLLCECRSGAQPNNTVAVWGKLHQLRSD